MKEIFTSFYLRKYDPQSPSYVEVAVNWATDLWPSDSPPPLPPDDYPYIGREIIFIGEEPFVEGQFDFFYEILEYNPEWVSIDVRGYNFIIENGWIEHTCLGSLDLSFVITGKQPKEANVEIEKTVWDLDLQEWVEEIDANIGETVSFQIVVNNNGGYDLTNIEVIDTLPICLEYVDGSAIPVPTSVVGNVITWNFPGPLSYCETITINFNAEVVSEGENINVVDVTADSYPYPEDPVIVTDADTAIVNGVPPGVDIIPPEIVDISLRSSEPLDVVPGIGWENTSCNVTDAGVGVDEVKLVVTNPDNTTTEYSMTNIPGTDTYYYNTTLTDAGDYTYHIWADDTSNNSAESTPEQTFLLPENWEMNDDRFCDISDLRKVSLQFGEIGPDGWIRQDYNNDGICDISDLRKVALRFGDTY